jgi:hypothetical protein
MEDNKQQQADTTSENLKSGNKSEYYHVQRKEFGHGQSGTMMPSDEDESINRYNMGRDVEENIGYRDGYNQLDNDAPSSYGSRASEQGRSGITEQSTFSQWNENVILRNALITGLLVIPAAILIVWTLNRK